MDPISFPKQIRDYFQENPVETAADDARLTKIFQENGPARDDFIAWAKAHQSVVQHTPRLYKTLDLANDSPEQWEEMAKNITSLYLWYRDDGSSALIDKVLSQKDNGIDADIPANYALTVLELHESGVLNQDQVVKLLSTTFRHDLLPLQKKNVLESAIPFLDKLEPNFLVVLFSIQSNRYETLLHNVPSFAIAIRLLNKLEYNDLIKLLSIQDVQGRRPAPALLISKEALPLIGKLEPKDLLNFFSAIDSYGMTPLHDRKIFKVAFPLLLNKLDLEDLVKLLTIEDNFNGKTPLHDPDIFQAAIPFLEQSFSNFVYDHRTDLKLDEDHPLWQLAFLQMQQAYLESPNKILKSGIKLSYLDSKDLVGTDSKIDVLSKVQFEKLKKMKSEMANIDKTKTKDLGLGEEIESTQLRSADVSEEEARLFQEALGTFNSPGKIGKFFINDRYKPPVLLKDKKLENGMIISVPFLLAMNFYTTAHYRLMNGTLDNDQKNIDLWKKESQKAGKNVTEDFVREAQEHVMQITKVAVAGMNKLPPYEGLLYRGASITPAKLEELRQGAVILTKKFLSCSTNVNVCETFAKRSTKENIESMQSEYKPVLYVYKSENAKDIREFSNYKHEDERVYTPGQGFRSVKVDEKTIPGLAIIYMQEMN